MQITEKLLKPLPEVQYLNTENTDRYRCIMRIFYENTEKLHNWMYQEEVYEALRVFPEFRDYRLEQCQQDLTSLVNWHNLETLQDTRHVSSLEEFQSRRYRYQMSPYSVEIERLVLRLEHLEIEGGSLEPTLLERIRRAIERFPEMVDAEPAEAYDFWDDLERNFTRLNQNYHDYIRDLSSVRAEEMMHTQEFLLFKDKLVEYLRNFVTSLQRNVGVIEELLQALSPSLCEAVLEKVNAYEAAIPRMEQVAPETIAENNRGKLESIRRWFQTSEGEDNEAGKLFDATNDIIRRITRFAMEMSEKSAMGSNRREEYRKVAELFLACEDLSEAHQLSACIFGVETPRHLRSEVEANSQSMNMSAYALEPERKQLKSRSRKGTERSNRSAITDHSEEKKAMRQQILEAQRARNAALWELEQDGCIDFSALPCLTRELREVLLRWVSDALEDPGRTARTEDGRRFILECAGRGERCVVHCEDGDIEMPKMRIVFEEEN